MHVRRNQPCPRCGGTDRYNSANDVAETGAVFCRQCFNKTTGTRPGDGIASIAWWMNLTSGDAIKCPFPATKRSGIAQIVADILEVQLRIGVGIDAGDQVGGAQAYLAAGGEAEILRRWI